MFSTDNNKRPCNCQICNGRVRDKRTIQRHFGQYQAPLGGGVQDQSENNLLEITQTTQHVSGSVGEPQGFGFEGNDVGDAVENLSNDGVSSFSDISRDSDLTNDDIGNDLPDSAPSSPEPEQPTVVLTDEKVRDFVLRTVLAKTHYGWSQGEALQQIQKLF